jgi:UDP-3-O-[3-hydroxymyristoyl] glucosamine N-acyltransferase
MAYTVARLAELVGGEVLGDGSVEIGGAAAPESGKPGEISYVLTEAHLESALGAQPSCLIIPPGLDPKGVPAIVSAEPKWAFAVVLDALYPRAKLPEGTHPTAAVDPAATLGRDVRIGPHACIGAEARLDDGVQVGAGSVVEAGAWIGRDTLLHPRVVVRHGCVLGERCEVHTGAVVGSEGFGYVTHEGAQAKFPQTGHVIVGDDVEIGSNTTIDRGALEPTRIGNGTKIDNLVQIGHNVQIGEHCTICAQVGIGGSSVIGNRVIMAGQAALADHVVVEDGAILLARAAGAPGKTLRGGQMYWGAPARPVKEAIQAHAAITRLPSALRRLGRLEREIAKLRDDAD